MICGKSRSSWLDRLRIAKGFPEDGVADLEQFLQNPTSPDPELPPPKPNSVSIGEPARNGDQQLFNIMSNVLNELFNFGDKCSNSPKSKKSARKQKNPRICSFSNGRVREKSNAAPEKVTLLRSGDSNSGVGGVEGVDGWENEGEGAARDGNLEGFSRTEVMVIDTSYESWKFEKMLYRKKNAWKVRDKKGKSALVGGKKKRKMTGAMGEDQNGGKKWKIDKKEGSAEQCGNEVYHQMKTSEVHNKAPNKDVRTLKRKQSDLNLEYENSSVILIKSIHTSKKDRTTVPKSCLKSKQKKT